MSQRHEMSRSMENVLVLQGGGSLGAFGCGVFKALYNNGIKFDIVGGTSIGAVNAAIICGSKKGDPAQDLENFWIDVAESSYGLLPDILIPYYDSSSGTFGTRKMPWATANSVMFGVPRFFTPRWLQLVQENYTDLMQWPMEWTHYYDHTPLIHTLEKYVDYGKISRKAAANKNTPRMIATAVNVKTAEALVFDSAKMDVQPKHILASCAYSAYGFPWINIDTDVYAWDGSLLSNTPLKEVMEASPRNDKDVYIVENYPRRIDRLPANRSEVVDRTRDIIFSDKTIYDLRAWKHMSRQTDLIEKLYDIVEKKIGIKSLDPSLSSQIKRDYDELVGKYGAEIKSIHRIARNRMESPHILKNADFSVRTIKDLIRQGEQKTREHLKSAEDPELAELLKLLHL